MEGKMEKGIIYLNDPMVSPDISRCLMNINNIRSIMYGEDGTGIYDDDNTMIDVYSSDDDDILNGSLLVSITVDKLSKYHGDILKSLCTISDILNCSKEGSCISELDPNKYAICVLPNAVLSEETVAKMKTIVATTSNSTIINGNIDIVFSDVSIINDSVDTTVKEDYIAPLSRQPIPPNVNHKNKHTEKVDEDRLAKMAKASETLDALVARINKLYNMKDDIIETISAQVFERVVKKLDLQLKPKPEQPVKIEDIIKEEVSIITDDESATVNEVDDTDETVVYNTTEVVPEKVTLDILINDCGNDDQLFNAVIKHKNVLTHDELLNVSTYNMFEYISNSKTVKLPRINSLMRKKALGLI